MGVYLNELYAESVNSEIHVDKSLLIRETNRRIRTNEKYVSLGRPRRFGKSMAAHMLMAYCTRGADSRELFRGKKISAVPSFERLIAGERVRFGAAACQNDMVRLNSADDVLALAQIRRREYPEALKGFRGS